MLPCLNRHSVQFAVNGKYTLRNVSNFNRDKKFYELTVDQDEQEIKNRPNPLADIEHKINESKKKLVWRHPPEKPFSIASEILGIFATERQRAAHLQRITKPLRLDLTWKTFMEEREKRRLEVESLLQSFLPERHQILGNNLAAAHFLVHRGGAVRFTKSPEWVKKNEDDEFDLPRQFDPDWVIDGIKCNGMELFYEGLENIRRLHSLKTFSLKNVKQFDDWCLDRIAGNQFENLEELDISGTSITANGLVAVPKLQSLKVLIVSDVKRSPAFELSLLMLEDILPGLKILEAEKTVEVTEQKPQQ